MKTIYIDVYFLINFTVDLLALHFSSAFSKIPIKNSKLILAATLGGLYAVGLIFLPQNLALYASSSILFLFLTVLICGIGISLKRKVKFIFAYFMFLTFVGGIVYFAFNFVDKHINLTESTAELQNRTLLLLSVAILFSIGLLKLIFAMFSGTVTERAVTVKIALHNKTIVTTAFVDTGNLAVDPVDTSPVLLIKRKTAEKLFSAGVPELYDGRIPEKYKGRIRLIPINSNGKTEILCGFRADSVSVIKEKREERIKVTIALDKEGGTFGGYEALMPASALENL